MTDSENSQTTVNDARTPADFGTKLTQPVHGAFPMVNDFNPKTIRKQLDAMRRRHGADSPVGHRCSNLIEQLKNLDGATGDQKAALEKNIAKSVADLARLTAPHAEHRG